MIKIIIENTMTVVLIVDEEGKTQIMGNLINEEGIIEIIDRLNPDQILINLNGKMLELNQEATHFAYHKILDNKKNIKERKYGR